MPAKKFTLKTVAQATAPGSYTWFVEPRGLGIRVTANGSRSFIFRRTVQGRQVMKSLGPVTASPDLDAVRALWRRAELAVEQQAGQPVAAGITLLDICKRHVATLADPARLASKDGRRPLTATAAQHALRRYEQTLAVNGMGALKPSQLSKPLVDVWLEALKVRAVRYPHAKAQTVKAARQGGMAARHARAMLLAALRKSLVPYDPAAFAVPNLPGTRARTVALSAVEAQRLEQVLQTSATRWRVFFTLLLATGMRKGELRKARAEWLRGAALHVPAEARKNNRALLVPLDGECLALFAELTPENGWFFPSPTDPTQPMAAVNVQWAKIRRAAGLSHVRPHDLRRSFGVFAAKAGQSALQISAALGNSSHVAALHYAQMAGEAGVISGVQAASRAQRLAV